MALFVMLRVAFLLCCELTFIVMLWAYFYCYAVSLLLLLLWEPDLYCYSESQILLLCWARFLLLCWGPHFCCYAECRYDECRYAECRGAVKNHATPAMLYLAPSPTRSQVVVTHLWWLRRLSLHAVLLHRRRYDDPVSFCVCLRRCNLFPENPNRWFNLYAETSGLYYKSCTIVITVRS
jgi:hypothetical protein